MYVLPAPPLPSPPLPSPYVLQLSRCPLQSLSNVPEELRETVKAMLCVEPAVRPDAVTVAKVSYLWLRLCVCAL